MKKSFYVVILLTGFLGMGISHAESPTEVFPAESSQAVSHKVPALQNFIRNGSFESASLGVNSIPDGWTMAGKADVGVDQSDAKAGSYSLIVSRTKGALISQPISDFKGLKGKKVVFGAWVKGNASDQIKLKIDTGVSEHHSDAYSGSGEWELLKVEADVEEGATQLQTVIKVNAKDSVLIDAAMLYPQTEDLVFTANRDDGIQMPSGLVYTDSETQSVGIGTKEPQEKLDVAGNVNVSGAGKVAGDLAVSGDLIVDGKISTKESLMAESIVDPTGQNVLGLGPWDQNTTSVYLKDANKKVGVGTAGPQAKLHISSSDSSGTGVLLQNTDSGGANVAIMSTGSGNDGGAGLLRFDNPGGTPRLVINSGGNVGVGTTAPDTRLHVVAPLGVNDIAHFRSDNGNADVVIGATSEKVAQIYTKTGQGLSLATNQGVDRIRITSDGNVGIGTTNPQVKLDVAGIIYAGTASNAGQIKFARANDGLYQAGIGYPGPSDDQELRIASVGGGSFMSFYTGPSPLTEKMRIDQYGNVGIGKTSPQYPLDVNGSVNGNQLCIATDCRSGWPSTSQTFWSGDSSSIYYNGNVGIGTASPTAKLHVADGILLVSNGAITVTGNTSETTLALENKSASGKNWLLRSTGDNSGHGGGKLVFDIGGVANASVDANGNFGARGSVGATQLCIGSDCRNAWPSTSGGGDSVWNKSGADIYYTAGNVGIGTSGPSVKLDVNGDLRVKYTIQGGPDDALTLRAASGRAISFKNGDEEHMRLSSSGDLTVTGSVTGSNITAQYQDLAEWVTSSEELEPGMVVIVDPDRDNEVIASSQAYDTRVAGVVSPKPGLILGQGGENRYMIAHTGRVKVKVDASSAPIHKGDLLVCSSQSGVAMKSKPIALKGREIHQPGTILGKALENLEEGQGEILVLLSLQ